MSEPPRGLKILVTAKTRFALSMQLRRLAMEVEYGNNHLNVADGEGTRMMRPLADVREMP